MDALTKIESGETKSLMLRVKCQKSVFPDRTFAASGTNSFGENFLTSKIGLTTSGIWILGNGVEWEYFWIPISAWIDKWRNVLKMMWAKLKQGKSGKRFSHSLKFLVMVTECIWCYKDLKIEEIMNFLPFTYKDPKSGYVGRWNFLGLKNVELNASGQLISRIFEDCFTRETSSYYCTKH